MEKAENLEREKMWRFGLRNFQMRRFGLGNFGSTGDGLRKILKVTQPIVRSSFLHIFIRIYLTHSH